MPIFLKDKSAVLQPKTHRAQYILLSFLLPLLILLVALAGLHVTPFGDKTLLIADANGLYINYLGYVGRMVKGSEGFLYSFEKGLGGNMLPNIGITMLDPFFPLFACFNIRDYPTAYTYVCVLNCSLCGLTMYVLLANLFGYKRSNLLFSTAYALMGFNVANVFQVFFFTGAHVLPLMVLGLRKIIQGKSTLIYILSLGYAILTSYYFGFMLCAASVVLFSLALWLFQPKLEGKKKKVFFKYALASVCGGLIGAVIWLPSLLGISGGRLDQTHITDFSFGEFMPFLEIGAKLFTGANNGTEIINGRPNVFVGILPVALMILFFLNKEIDRRKKTAAGLALGVYLISFYIVAFNMVMHGGTVTNWFNFRYSFVFSFLMLIIAAEEWQQLDSLSFTDCKKCGAILLIGTILVFSRIYDFVNGGEVLLDFGLLMLMFGAFYMYRKDSKKNPLKVLENMLLLITSFQLMLNFVISTHNLIKEKVWDNTISEYHDTVDMVAPLVEGIQNKDAEFYRIDANKQRAGNSGNDPMLYGYNGVGHSGSYERDFVRSGIAKLGIHWYQTRNYYQEGVTPATDTLLGLKYIIAQEDLTKEKGYQNATNMKQIALLQNQENYDIYYNPDALAVAFLSETAVDTVETDFVDIFDNLNNTWAAVSGQDKPVFVEECDIHFHATNLFDGLEITADSARKLTEKYEAEAENAKADPVSASIASEKKTADKTQKPEYSAYIEFTFTAKQNGAIYIYNRGIMTEKEGAYGPVLEFLGTYQKGDTVTGYIPVATEYVNRIGFEEICGRFRAAYAEINALHELATIVKNRPCTIEKIKDSHLRGEFTAESGQKLMFTIPYDEGWTCYIDGEEVPINMVLGVFMAVDVPEGTHSYEMKFFPTGMKTGIGLSAAALLATIVYIPMDTKHRKQKLAVQEGVPVEESCGI